MKRKKIKKLLNDGAELYLNDEPMPEGDGQKTNWVRQGYIEAKQSINAVVDECQLLTRGYDV